MYRDLMLTNHLLEAEQDRPYQRVLKTARKQHIPIFIIAFNTDRNLESNTVGADEYERLRIIFPKSSVPTQYLEGVRSRMEGLVEASGGRILYPRRLEEIVPLYQQIGRELGTSYTLGYLSSNPQKDGSFRRIEIRTHDEGFSVTQSRTGYYAR